MRIGYLELLYLVILVVPTLIINHYLGIKLNRETLISILRMTVQLSLVGVYLQYIFDLNSPMLNMAYVLVMMGVATYSIAGGAGLRFTKMYGPIFVSIAIPNVLLLFFFNRFVLGAENVFDARYFITIGGMLMGNVLSGDIIGLTRFYRGIWDNRALVNYDLSLGATRFQAVKPYLIEAISATIKPTIASMATIGLVALPGMMTGQILGGSVPREAIMYQIAIMIAIYLARYSNIFFSILLSQRFMFDAYDQLNVDLSQTKSS